MIYFPDVEEVPKAGGSLRQISNPSEESSEQESSSSDDEDKEYKLPTDKVKDLVVERKKLPARAKKPKMSEVKTDAKRKESFSKPKETKKVRKSVIMIIGSLIN